MTTRRFTCVLRLRIPTRPLFVPAVAIHSYTCYTVDASVSCFRVECIKSMTLACWVISASDGFLLDEDMLEVTDRW